MPPHPRDVLKLVLSKNPELDFAELAKHSIALRNGPSLPALIAKANLCLSLGDFGAATDASAKAVMLDPNPETLYLAAESKVALALAISGSLVTGSGVHLPDSIPLKPLIEGAMRNLNEAIRLLPEDFDARALRDSLAPLCGKDIDELMARSRLAAHSR